MRTRIREIRRLRNLTLQQLADMVGTTAQTIQRLETDNMTVSLDWLEKIAAAFELNVAALLPGTPLATAPENLGSVGPDFEVTANGASAIVGQLTIAVPGQDTVMLQLTQSVGPFASGTTLIGRRLGAEHHKDAHGRTCVVKLRTQGVFLRRIAVEGPRLFASHPFENRGSMQPIDADWLAPLMLAVRPI